MHHHFSEEDEEMLMINIWTANKSKEGIALCTLLQLSKS
jgi:hypothetical protein